MKIYCDNDNKIEIKDNKAREDIEDLKTLLMQVRDALQNGDIDEAINLLDTFLLGENGGTLL